MTEQRVKAKSIPPLKGILLILGVVVGLMLASFLGQILSQFVPPIWPSLIIWLLTGVFVVMLMREQIIEYNYTVNNGTLYVERLYGMRTKVLLTLRVSEIIAFGDEAQLREKYPQAKAIVAVLRAVELPRKAIAYAKPGKVELCVLQPDAHMQALLWDPAIRAASAKEKWG